MQLQEPKKLRAAVVGIINGVSLNGQRASHVTGGYTWDLIHNWWKKLCPAACDVANTENAIAHRAAPCGPTPVIVILLGAGGVCMP